MFANSSNFYKDFQELTNSYETLFSLLPPNIRVAVAAAAGRRRLFVVHRRPAALPVLTNTATRWTAAYGARSICWLSARRRAYTFGCGAGSKPDGRGWKTTTTSTQSAGPTKKPALKS